MNKILFQILMLFYFFSFGTLPAKAQTEIPLRFVETQRAHNSQPLHTDEHIQLAVKRVNKIWSSTGIKFWVRSIDRYHMPNLHKYIRDKDPEGCSDGGAYCFKWIDVRKELQQVFPNMPANAYPVNDDKSAGYWLHAASALYGDPNEILIWLVDERGPSGMAPPWTGRMVFIRKSDLWVSNQGIPSTTLAHEIGHFLGPRHSDDSSLPKGYNHCDRWDQVFIPDEPNVFFSSPEDANCDPSKVKYIAKALDKAYTDNKFGPVHVLLNNEEYLASGSSVNKNMKGLLRSTGLPHNPPESWGFSINVMGGFKLDGAGIDGTVPRFFSDSQTNMIRKFLAKDVAFDQDKKNLWITDNGVLPLGSIQGGLTSLRSKLGKNLRVKIIGAPSVASWGPNRLDVFVRGEDNHLWHKRYSAEKGWSGWRNLGGHLTSSPVIVSWGPDRLDVFVKGANNQLDHKRYSRDKGWSEWRDLGGQLTSAPTAVSWGENRLDVFVKGINNQLAHKRYSHDKGWSNWRDLGGRLTSAPIAVSWGPNRLDVFVKGFNNQLAHKRYSHDKGWSEWVDLGGRLTSPPTAVSWGANRLDVFVKGFNNKLAHKRYSQNKSWSEWRDLGGRLTSDPTSVSWGPNRLDVFVRGYSGKPAHKRYSRDKSWSDWQDLGKYQ